MSLDEQITVSLSPLFHLSYEKKHRFYSYTDIGSNSCSSFICFRTWQTYFLNQLQEIGSHISIMVFLELVQCLVYVKIM